METKKLECCKCGWLGEDFQRVPVPCTDPDLADLGNISDMTCPLCGNVEFYEVKFPKKADLTTEDTENTEGVCDEH